MIDILSLLLGAGLSLVSTLIAQLASRQMAEKQWLKEAERQNLTRFHDRKFEAYSRFFRHVRANAANRGVPPGTDELEDSLADLLLLADRGTYLAAVKLASAARQSCPEWSPAEREFAELVRGELGGPRMELRYQG
jgi:hypothetical protein